MNATDITTDLVIDAAKYLRGHIHRVAEHGEDHALYCIPAADMLEALARDRDEWHARACRAECAQVLDGMTS